MKKLKVFDVVELNDGNNATILDNQNYVYKAEIVNLKGESQGIKDITDNDIRKILFSK